MAGWWRVLLATALVSVTTPVLVLTTSPGAQAVPATSGAGRLIDSIDWFEWGTAGTTIPNAGLTRTQDRTVGGQVLSTTCAIGAVTSTNTTSPALQVTSPGAYRFDTFDDLYNSGSTGAANTLDVALANRSGGDTVTFPVSCSATLGGVAVPIDGLVMADAESINGANEYVSATIPPTATWRIVDRFSAGGCTNPINALRDAGNRLTLTSPGVECGASAVAFMDGATTATVQLKGGGVNAVALGVVVSQDHGDAPASFGDAAHGLVNDFAGGTLPAGTSTNVSAAGPAGFVLATPVVTSPRLGAGTDPEGVAATSAGATGDDTSGSTLYGGPDDEDALTVPSPLRVAPGGAYDQTVSCVGATSVAGWLDWNDDGDFADVGERSTGTPACAGGLVDLAWTVPADVDGSTGADVTFLRVRTAAAASEIADPTGFALSGEVEDYAVNVAVTRPPLSCSGTYALQGAGPRNVLAVAPTTGVFTTTGSAFGSIAGAADGTAANALGISGDGTKVYSIVAGAADADVRLIQVLDRTTGTVSQVGSITIPAGTLANVLYGAVDPRTGVYYFGGTRGTTVLVYGYDPSTGTVLGQVASGTLPAAPGTNGDFGFDNQDTLYVVASSATTATVYSIGERLPRTAGAPVGLSSKPIVTVTDNASTAALVVGLAFGSQGSRRIHLAGPSTIRTVDPGTGAVETRSDDSGAVVNGVSDLASCSSPNTLEGQVSFPGGRAAPADQATVTITGGGIAANNAGTTSGADSGVQDTPAETAGPLFGLDGTTYTFTQSGLRVDRYATTYTCTDLNTGTVLTSGSGTTATFTVPGGAGPVGTAAYCRFINTPLVPAITLDKVAGTPTGNRPGATVPYRFVVTNTGNVELASISVSDPKLAGAGGSVTCAGGPLAVGATRTCTASYVLTQADVNAGRVDNSATATGVSSVAGLPDATASDTDTVAVVRAPAISLLKRAAPDPGADTRLDAGDTITYTFVVTNTGNVTLDPVGVTDAKAGAVSCPLTTLDAGAATTCTAATYVVTQADVDAGSVDNTATASGTPPVGPAETATSRTSTPTYSAAALELDKRVGASTDVNGNGRVDAGDRLAYSFVVTNTGTVTLRDVSVADPKAGTVACPSAPLVPGRSTTCTASYVISQADVDAGAVNNSATASASPPVGATVTSEPDTTSTPVSTTARLTLDKSVDTLLDVDLDGRTDAGDRITYRFLVTNTGSVTLRALVVDDVKVGATTCLATSLLPGVATTCSATYTITQADVDSGAVDNTATASALPPTGSRVPSGPDSTSTGTSTAASIAHDQTVLGTTDVNGNGLADVGDTVDYRYLVVNTGSVTLSTFGLTDSLGNAITCPPGPLSPGDSVACTSTHSITQADVDTGAVVNVSTATGVTGSGGRVRSGPDTTTVPTNRVGTLTLDKEAATLDDRDDDGRVDAGDVIGYTFLVTNAGTVTVRNLVVVDRRTGPVSCPATTLAPTVSTTCTAPYTITQADVDLGSVDNTATVIGSLPDGAPLASAPDSTTTPTTSSGRLSLDKRAGRPVDVNGNGRVDAGDRITYSFVVTNDGTLTLSDPSIDDDKVVGGGQSVTCPAGRLAPGASTTCTASYAITQADVDLGAVRNVATASATTPGGGSVPSLPDTTSTTTSAIATLGIDKRAGAPVDVDGDGRTDAGDRIVYSFVVTNTGAVTLTDVDVDDAKVAGTRCPTTTLAPGASTTCTASYTITQADVDSGSVVNSATATGTPPTGGPATSRPDTTATPTAGAATLTLDKQAAAPFDANGSGRLDAGDTIAYRFVVTNTGAVTLTDPTVADATTGPVDCPTGPLAPGTPVTCLVSYVITQLDLDRGAVENTATASATRPGGATLRSEPDTTLTPLTADRALTLDKQADAAVDVDGNGRVDAGDTIGYRFVVTNTGAITLTGVQVNDLKVTAGGGSVTCATTELPPGASTTCTTTYVVTQADADSGAVVNMATASGLPLAGPDVISGADSTTTPTGSDATLTLDKSAAAPTDVNNNGRVDAGDTVRYSFLVTNTGSVTLTGVRVDDPMLAQVTCPATTLAPGAAVTCTQGYALTQADVDSGSVDNTATASGAPPTGPRVGSSPDSTSTPTAAARSLTIDKQAGTPVDVDADRVVDAGDRIPYRFVVTNTGDVTLTGIRVTDPLLAAGAVSCPVSSLAPAASTTCTATYSITQADVDAGGVVNTATAGGQPPSGAPITSASDTTTTSTATRGSLSVDKRAGTPVDVDGDGVIAGGDTIGYRFVITNDGPLTLTDLTVDDALLPGSGAIACPVTTLAPGDVTVCTASYTITAGDAAAGAVVNTATVTGTSPRGTPVVSPSDTTTTPTGELVGAVALDKRASAPVDEDGDGVVGVGDAIDYTFVVTNIGAVPLDGVVVDDPMLGAVGCPPVTLPVGDTLTCSETYLLTAADVAAGSVANTATVGATTPGGVDVVSAPDSTQTVVPAAGTGLTLDKNVRQLFDSNGNGVTDPGDQVTYEFVLTNTGDGRLFGLTISDPMLTRLGIEIDCPGRTLAPGESTICVSGRYTVTAADATDGQLVNTATVSGIGPQGEVVAGNQDVVDVAVVAGAGGGDDGSDDGSGDGTGDDPGDGAGAGDGDGGTLPDTGNEVSAWMPISSSLLVLFGLALVLGGRRRRRPWRRRVLGGG